MGKMNAMRELRKGGPISPFQFTRQWMLKPRGSSYSFVALDAHISLIKDKDVHSFL